MIDGDGDKVDMSYGNVTGSYQNDPNTMDINRVTTEEHEKHMQEDQSFNSHKIGQSQELQIQTE